MGATAVPLFVAGTTKIVQGALDQWLSNFLDALEAADWCISAKG